MKAVTFLASVAAGACLLAGAACAEALEGWGTDLDKALEQAKKDNKPVLVEFTGSDWCPPCMMMRKEVFSKKSFVDKASKDFILVELDFPKKDKELAEKNQPLAQKYKIGGFPTVILLRPDGKEFDRFVASKFPKENAFLKHLKEALETMDLD